MLLKLAEALGRLVLAGRELSRLAGFTARMTELSVVLKDLNSGNYERSMVSNSSSADVDEFAPGKGTIAFQVTSAIKPKIDSAFIVIFFVFYFIFRITLLNSKLFHWSHQMEMCLFVS